MKTEYVEREFAKGKVWYKGWLDPKTLKFHGYSEWYQYIDIRGEKLPETQLKLVFSIR